MRDRRLIGDASQFSPIERRKGTGKEKEKNEKSGDAAATRQPRTNTTKTTATQTTPTNIIKIRNQN